MGYMYMYLRDIGTCIGGLYIQVLVEYEYMYWSAIGAVIGGI